MENLDNLSSKELKELLKKLKLYKDLTKNLGKRGKEVFEKIINNKHSYKVEYFPSLNEQEAKKEALEIIKKVFSENIGEEDINLLKKESLKGGLRIFKDDNLVDLSFSKIEKNFK